MHIDSMFEMDYRHLSQALPGLKGVISRHGLIHNQTVSHLQGMNETIFELSKKEGNRCMTNLKLKPKR